jgi:prepilin peptidase CpaA
MSDLWHFSVYLFPILVSMAAVNDLMRYQIQNWIPISIFMIFFPVSFGLGWSLTEIGMSALCFGAMLGVGFILFILKLFGGGDAKLIAASSLWIGWQLLPSFMMITALFGGVLALFILLFRKLYPADKVPQIRWVEQLYDKKNGIPYGIAIAGAVLVLFPKIRIVEPLFLN